jgi:hypothetical protein
MFLLSVGLAGLLFKRLNWLDTQSVPGMLVLRGGVIGQWSVCTETKDVCMCVWGGAGGFIAVSGPGRTALQEAELAGHTKCARYACLGSGEGVGGQRSGVGGDDHCVLCSVGAAADSGSTCKGQHNGPQPCIRTGVLLQQVHYS